MAKRETDLWTNDQELNEMNNYDQKRTQAGPYWCESPSLFEEAMDEMEEQYARELEIERENEEEEELLDENGVATCEVCGNKAIVTLVPSMVKESYWSCERCYRSSGYIPF